MNPLLFPAWTRSCARWARRSDGVALGAVLAFLAGCSEDLPPPPPQPIAFSHMAHVQNEIECTRCHVGVETQAEAGLPPISTCAVCHRREIPDHPEVQRFMTYMENEEPILWRKVHVIPTSAMVHFKHSPHVAAGVECATCHGDVGQMTVAQQMVNVADMGWCIACHQEQGASTDCLTCHH